MDGEANPERLKKRRNPLSPIDNDDDEACFFLGVVGNNCSWPELNWQGAYKTTTRPPTTTLQNSNVIGKISVYKHCFCYSNLSTTGTKDPLFRQPIRLWLAHQ